MFGTKGSPAVRINIFRYYGIIVRATVLDRANEAVGGLSDKFPTALRIEGASGRMAGEKIERLDHQPVLIGPHRPFEVRVTVVGTQRFPRLIVEMKLTNSRQIQIKWRIPV